MENPTYIDTSKFTNRPYPQWKSLFFEAMEEKLETGGITQHDYGTIDVLFADMENDARYITDIVANLETESDLLYSEELNARNGNIASYLIINTGLALNMMNILRTIDLDCKAFDVDHPLGLPNSLQELVWLATKITADRAITINEFIIEDPEPRSERQKQFLDNVIERMKKTHPLPDHRSLIAKREIKEAIENGLFDTN